jgi:hypothetical protein
VTEKRLAGEEVMLIVNDGWVEIVQEEEIWGGKKSMEVLGIFLGV